MMKLILNHIKKVISFLFQNSELLFWICGLVYLSLVIPGENHFTFCPLKNFGINFCPGCGLGQSISLIFHLKIFESFQAHPLGLFALIIILYRITQLIKTKLRRDQYA
jgi:hypothetical protein